MNDSASPSVFVPARSASPRRWCLLALLLSALVGTTHAQRAESAIHDEIARLEQVYEVVRSGGAPAALLEEVADLKVRVTRRPLPATAERAERRQLARAWKLVAAISRDLEGDTDLVLEYYRVAASLDPDDAELAAELTHRQRKMDAVTARLEEARRIREAQASKN